MSNHFLQDPSAWVTRWAPLIKPRSVILDLACGSGRHSIYLASLGHRVIAVDRDMHALNRIPQMEGIERRCLDLEQKNWPLKDEKFSAIVVTNYLHRKRFSALLSGLETGGIFIYETFAKGNEVYGKPSRTDFLLAGGELLERVKSELKVIAYEEGIVKSPSLAVIQRICAYSGPESAKCIYTK